MYFPNQTEREEEVRLSQSDQGKANALIKVAKRPRGKLRYLAIFKMRCKNINIRSKGL